VLAVMPVASVLSNLPKAVLSGLVIAAVFSLIEVRSFLEAWRFSKPQFVVAVVTLIATLVSAPRVERGIVLGVALSLAVHLWRELRIDTDAWVDGTTLNVRPQGVLYFGSAPALESDIMHLIASNSDLRSVVIHLEGLGRLDLTGALVLRSLIDDLRARGTHVYFEGTPPQAERLVNKVVGRHHALILK
jgi:SulP family sulfate permease